MTENAPNPPPTIEDRLAAVEARLSAAETALASVIAPQVSQSSHDGFAGAMRWLEEKLHLVSPPGQGPRTVYGSPPSSDSSSA